MHKVKTKRDGLYIAFETSRERTNFIEAIQNYARTNVHDYLTTFTFFKILGEDPNPYNNYIGWYEDELRRINTFIGLDLNYQSVLVMPVPHPLLPRGETKKNIPGIDDGGERIRYGENGAFREPADGKGRFDLVSPFALQRLARWYELGAKKYEDRNWEKGIPFSRYMDSAMRHLTKYMMGMTDEDHLAAAAWNITCIMHHEELGQMELDDLPHYYQKKLAEKSSGMVGKE